MKSAEELTRELVDLFNNRVISVVNGVLEEAHCSLLSIGHVVDFLNSLGEQVGDLETNGWQYDYWVTYKINNKYYKLNGCGYYGGIKFYEVPAKDIEDELEMDSNKDIQIDHSRVVELLNKVDDILNKKE